MNEQEFRNDIQGLRAIAVLMIVLYHFGVSWLPGGFIGVDVFFVISGYLITKNIINDLNSQQFSLFAFYGKRIRRLLPVFTVVATITVLISFFIFLPIDQETVAKTMLSASVYLSNIYFKISGFGYFSEDVNQFPLLHYWSLSAEEQFYFIWPILLLVAYPFLFKGKGHTATITISALLLLTLGISEYTLEQDAGAAFYYVHARAFEFLFGILIVFLERKYKPKTSLANGVALVGLAAILASLFLINDAMHFPGVTAIPACLGTALVIWAGNKQNSISKILALPLLVFFGSISYSLYLWHWPPVAFANYLDIAVDYTFLVTVFPIVTLLAYITQRYVEVPFKRFPLKPKFILPIFISPILIACCFLGVSNIQQNTEQRTFAEGLNNQQHSPWDCMGRDIKASMLGGCVIGDEKADKISFALWGDSFADQYSVIFREQAKRAGKKGTLLIMQACPPAYEQYRNLLPVEPKGKSERCIQYAYDTINSINDNADIKTVFVSANFVWYETGIFDDNIPIVDPEKSKLSIHQGFAQAVNQLVDADKKVIFVLPVALVNDLTQRLSKAQRVGIMPSIPKSEFLKVENTFLEKVYKAGMSKSVCVVRTSDHLCDGNSCNLLDEQQRSIYSDASHFSLYGMNKVLEDKCIELW